MVAAQQQCSLAVPQQPVDRFLDRLPRIRRGLEVDVARVGEVGQDVDPVLVPAVGRIVRSAARIRGGVQRGAAVVGRVEVLRQPQ